MKRIFTVLGVGLLFLTVIAAIVFKVMSPSTTEKPAPVATTNPFADISPSIQTVYTDTPYRTVVTCLGWYIHVVGNGANANLVAPRTEATQCFTADFIAQWPTIISSTGSDPILLSQDTGPTWGSSIQAQPIGQSVNSADEQVLIGSGTDQITLLVHTVRDQTGAWKIQSVSKTAATDGTQ
jgi:hypothetical protein